VVPVIPMASLAEGQTKAVKVESVDVLISHIEGQFYAIHAQCSHARQSLAAGKVRGHQIACPLHGARFDLRTGECLAAPASRPVAQFPVMIESGKVCVDVSSAQAPPRPKFGPIN